MVLCLGLLDPKAVFSQNFVTIGNPANTVTSIRAPFSWRDFTSYQRYSWSNIQLTDSLLNAVNLPNNIFIDSIAFFKVSPNPVSLPFFASMHMGAATPPLLPANWLGVLQSKREVLRQPAFQINAGQGPVVFKFSNPYAHWSGGIELATYVDYGPFAGNMGGDLTPNWVADHTLRDRFYVHFSNAAAFDSTAIGIWPIASQNNMPVIRLYYRQRFNRDLSLREIKLPSGTVQPNTPIQVELAITNEGLDTLFEANLSYQFQQGAPISQQFAINLPPDSSTTVIFSTAFQAPIGYQLPLRAWLNSVNGGLSDHLVTNDSLSLFVNTAITSDTVQVGQQQAFPNLQLLFNQLMVSNNPQQLTIILHENQQGNFNLSNYQLPHGQQLVLQGVHDSIMLQANLNGAVLSFNNVRGIQLKGLRIKHQNGNSPINYLLHTQNTSGIELRQNAFLGDSGVNRNHLVFIENTSEVLVQSNYFSYGNQALHFSANSPLVLSRQLSVLDNRFENQQGTGLLVSGTQAVDSLWIEGNDFSNTQLPQATAAAIKLVNTTRFNIIKNRITGNVGQYGIHISRFEGDSLRSNRIINNVVSGEFVNALCSAFKLQGVNQGGDSLQHHLEVYFNSIQVRRNAPLANGASAIDLTTSSTLAPVWNRFDFRNNLVVIQAPNNSNGAGILGDLYQAVLHPKVTFSHNHYHMPGQPIYKFPNYGAPLTLSNWRTNFPNSEQFSTMGDPLFFDAQNHDLRFFSNAPPSKTALPIPGITTDIEGQSRTNQPDIGAYVRQPLHNSTHLSALVSPMPGMVLMHDTNYVLSVKIKNTGDNTITQLQFGYVFGFGDTIREDWNGQLLSGDSLVYSFSQPLRIRSDSVFIPAFKVWNRQLIGNFTPSPTLDTLTAIYCTPLSAGTYILRDSTAASDAMDEWLRLLHCGGITGNVILKTDFRNNLLLNRPLVFNQIPGASSTRLLIVEGDGDTLRVTNMNTSSPMRLVRTKHVIIKGFVFDRKNFVSHTELLRIQNADSVAVTKNFFSASTAGISAAIRSNTLLTGGNSSHSHGIQIDSNHFHGLFSTVIAIEGNLNWFHKYIRITNNFISGLHGGISVFSVDSGEIAFNHITRSSNSPQTAMGVGIFGVNRSLHVHNNKIHGFYASNQFQRQNGIYIRSVISLANSRNYIYNNLIFDIQGGFIQSGINMANSSGMIVANNTISINDTLGATSCYGVFLDSLNGNSQFINNNIAINTLATTEARALKVFALNASLLFNYNNYHVKASSNAHQLIQAGTSVFSTLAAYRQAFPLLDSGSVSTNPLFLNISAQNFVSQSPALYQTGVAIPFVRNDFNGVLRPMRPSIGAVEDTVLEPVGIELSAFSQIESNDRDTISVRQAPLELIISGADTIASLILKYRQNTQNWILDTLLNVPGRQILQRSFGQGLLLRNGADTLQAIAIAQYQGGTSSDTVTKIVQNQFLTVLNVPYANDFETIQSLEEYQLFTGMHGQAVQVGLPAFNHPLQGTASLVMSAKPNAPGFSSNINQNSAFVLGLSHFSEVRMLVNPRRIGKLRLSFKLKMNGGSNTNFFRVQVNNTSLAPLPGPGVSTVMNGTPNSWVTLTYALDNINDGTPLLISLQSVVQGHFNASPDSNANIVDSLRIYFVPDFDFTELTVFNDTLCSPVARSVSIFARPFRPNITSTISSIQLHYQTGLNSWTATNMNLGAQADQYVATIPPQASLALLKYFVHVGASNGLSWSSDTLYVENVPYRIDLGPNRTIQPGDSTTLDVKFLDSGLKMVRITEFYVFRPGAGGNANHLPGITSAHDDLVEIANYGAETVNLDNLEVHFVAQGSNGTFIYHFPSGSVLLPLARAVLAIGQGTNNQLTNLYFTSHPSTINLSYSIFAKGHVVIREKLSQRFLDGVAVNDSVFPASMNVPAHIWSGLLASSNTSGFQRSNLRASGAAAWSANSTSNPHTIGRIDSTLLAGPPAQNKRWLSLTGQLLTTGDFFVVSPNVTETYCVETNWYNCLMSDTIVVQVPIVPQADLSISRIITPIAGDTVVINGPLLPSISVKNLSGTASGNFTVQFIADTSLVSSINVPQGLGGFDSMNVSFPLWLPNLRSYNLCYQLLANNDLDTTNHVLCKQNVTFVESVSVNELAQQQRLLLYPNPVSDKLLVQLMAQLVSSGKYKVVDVTGRQVFMDEPVQLAPDLLQFSVSHLAAGVYYLHWNVDGKMYQSKFMVGATK